MEALEARVGKAGAFSLDIVDDLLRRRDGGAFEGLIAEKMVRVVMRVVDAQDGLAGQRVFDQAFQLFAIAFRGAGIDHDHSIRHGDEGRVDDVAAIGKREMLPLAKHTERSGRDLLGLQAVVEGRGAGPATDQAGAAGKAEAKGLAAVVVEPGTGRNWGQLATSAGGTGSE